MKDDPPRRPRKEDIDVVVHLESCMRQRRKLRKFVSYYTGCILQIGRMVVGLNERN
jgi:hypothetical protein